MSNVDAVVRASVPTNHGPHPRHRLRVIERREERYAADDVAGGRRQHVGRQGACRSLIAAYARSFSEDWHGIQVREPLFDERNEPVLGRERRNEMIDFRRVMTLHSLDKVVSVEPRAQLGRIAVTAAC